jgi:hypothetical protein
VLSGFELWSARLLPREAEELIGSSPRVSDGKTAMSPRRIAPTI